MTDKNKSLECKSSHVPTGIKISLQSPKFIMHSSASYISAAVAFEPKKGKAEMYWTKALFPFKIIFLLRKPRNQVHSL